MMNSSLKIVLTVILYFISQYAFSILELDVYKGVTKKTPIGFSFKVGPEIDSTLIDVIANDLKISGEFLVNHDVEGVANKFLSGDINDIPRDMDYILSGEISHDNNKIVARVKFFDILNPKQALFDKQFSISSTQTRRLGHYITDLIYEKATGVQGVFSTKIAYVRRLLLPNKTLRYELVIADMDGKNDQLLLSSSEPIMSMSWSRDGKYITYVSFERKKSEIYVIELATGSRRLVTSFVGLNGAPKFSPDGKKLAIVLSRTGFPNIYLYDLEKNTIRRMTKSKSIDTEPEWSNDGKYIYFTSDRNNKRVQIYKLDTASLDVSRVTFNGVYNSTPQITRKGDQLVMLHKNNSGFNIALQNLHTNEFKVLTNTGHINNPSIAPNGKMVIFTSSVNNRKALKVMSINGQKAMIIKLPGRDILKPSWGPIV